MSEAHPTPELQVLAYEKLSSYFQQHHNHVLEIEILPPAIEPSDGFLLIDNLSIGIPKKILALAYIEARKQFFQHLNVQGSRHAAFLATKIILLFDPEHLTAGNFRKRHLESLKDDRSSGDHTIYRSAVKHEFCFLDSILTSPLHRQSKSPNLWHHRLWLLDSISPSGIRQVPVQHKTTFWETELHAVCKSGEQHPKNYYAWQYARNLLARVDGEDAAFDFARHVKNWCCQHPSDISGWTFLAHTLSQCVENQQKEELVRDVLDYAIVIRLKNESLWVFMRLVLANNATLQQSARLDLLKKLRGYSSIIAEEHTTSMLYENVKKSLDWINVHGIRHPGAAKGADEG